VLAAVDGLIILAVVVFAWGLVWYLLFVIFDLVFILAWLGSVFGDGAGFLEWGVVVGDGFRAPQTPRGACRLESVARHTPRFGSCLESVGLARTCP
jgi:hypothetical protein